MAQYDGSLKFDTNINYTGFNTGVKNITSSFKKIGKGVSTLSNRFNALNNIVKLVSSTIAVAFVTKGIKDSIAAAEEYQNALTGLKSIMDGQGKSFSKAQQFITSYTEDGLIPQTQAITAYKNLALRGYDTSQIEKVMTALKDSATYSRQSSYTLGEAVQSATEGLKNENSILVDNAGVTKNVAKMWEDYAKSIGKTTNNLTKQEKIQAEVNGILEETKFQTGDAETYMNSYSGMIARLNASFTTLKQTLGTAFIQIFQSILPLIQSVVNALIQLASIFASLVSSIFGKTISTNKDMASSSESAAESIESQGKAAEKAGEQAEGALLSFDKLNVLDDDTSKSSGGGGSSLPEIQLEDTGMSLAEEVQNAFEGMSAYEIGFAISEKINEGLESIDWISIQAHSQNIAYNIAMFLNGAVAGLDWSLLGYTIAETINTALIFAYTWLTTFDFTMFGVGLGNTLNGIVQNIDWQLLGQILGSNFQSTFDMLYGFVTTFDWSSLGTSLSTTIESFFSQVDWSKAGQAVGNGIKGVLDTLGTLLAEVDWQGVGEDVATFLEELDWITILANVGKVIEDALGATFDVAGGILGIDPLVLESLAIGFGSLAAAMTIFNTITSVTSAVTTAMSATMFPLIAVIGLVVLAITTVIWILTSLKEQFEIIGENWPIVWEAVKNKFSEVKDAVVTTVKDWVEKFVTKFNELKTKIGTILKNLKTTWTNIFNNIKTTTTEIFNNIWSVIKKVINSILGRYRIDGKWSCKRYKYRNKCDEWIKLRYSRLGAWNGREEIWF